MLFIAFPMGCHVIENIVTSTGTHSFSVDGEPIIPDVTEIPVTSNNEAK
jgi:hypothetical protein